MKQKCSFLLKSGIALILSFLMLFGTVTTSLAAVVENADTGADVDLAETGVSTSDLIKGDFGDSWADHHFNSSGDAYFDKTKSGNVDFGFTVSNNWLGKRDYSSMVVTATDTEYSAHKDGSNGSFQLSNGAYKVHANGSGDEWITYQFSSVTLYPASTKFYLKTNSSWESDGARFAAYFCNSAKSGEDGSWQSATACPGDDGYYYVTSPANSKYTTLIWCRMDGSDDTNNWDNKWNQTDDLAYETGKYMTTITGWNNSQTVSNTTHSHTITITGKGRDYDGGTISNLTSANSSGTPDWTSASTYNPASYKVATAPSDYTYTGMYTDAACTTAAGTSVTNTGDATYYALYTHNKVNVTFKNASGTGGTVSQGSTQIVSSLTTSGTTVSTDYNRSLSYTIYPADGKKITAVSGGASSWTITSGGTSATGTFSATSDTTVTVTQQDAGTCGFTLSKNSTTLNIGGTDTFTATPNAYHVSGTITASSSDSSVATVSKSNNTYTVTAVSHGTATITVSCTEGGSATISVTVSTPTISISAGSTSLYLGETTTITPTVTNQGNATVTYTSSDSTVASISGTTVTALKEGTTNITASVDGVTSSAVTITVNDPTITQSNITGKKVNDTGTFSATATPSGRGTITYSVASADSSKLVLSGTNNASYTCKVPGTYTVTATYPYTYNSVSKTVTKTFTVTVGEPTLTFNSLSIEEMRSGDLTIASKSPTPTGYSWSESDDKITLVGDTTQDHVLVAVNELTAAATANVTLRATYNDAYYKDYTATVNLTKSKIELGYNDGSDKSKKMIYDDTTSTTYNGTYYKTTLTLTGSQTITFWIKDSTSGTAAYYKNNGTISESASSYSLGESGWTFNTSDNNCTLTAGAAGTYAIYYVPSTHTVFVSFPSKEYYLEGFSSADGSWSAVAATQMTETGTGTNIFTFTKTFTAAQNPGDFKIYCNDGNWYGKTSQTFTKDSTSATLVTDSSGNMNITVAYSGTYTFTFNATTKVLTVTYPNRTVNAATSPASGPASLTGPTHVSGDTFELTAADNDAYVFSTWAALPSGVALASGYALTDKTIQVVVTTTSAVTLTANFTVRPDPVITYTAKKTDDGSTLENGGGTITAKEISYTEGTAGTGTASYYYLWWSGSDNPEQHTNKADAVKATDGSYYASFQPTGNFYFNITDSSSSATSGTQKITSNTTADVDTTVFAGWTTVGNWGTWYIGKGYLNSGDTVYIKYNPTENKVYFRNTAFTYTIEYTGGTGGTDPTETEIKTLSASVDTITYNHRVYFTATAATDYAFEGWYSNAACTTLLSTDKTYKTTDLTDDYTIYAKFKKLSFITLYNSYMKDANGDWQFIASPPRKVEIGSGDSKRTYVYDTGGGDQRGEEYVLYDGGTYYEGNKLVVYPGEKVKLIFSTLASSDAIKGVFFNNDRRYTTESETDNLYYLREYKEGGWGSGTTEDPYVGGLTGEGESVPDDDWEYTFLSGTTIYADSGYYTDEATTISAQQSNYAANKTGGAVDQSAHTIEWIAEGSYLNIDIQLDYKYQVHINSDDWSGLSIENMNDEGYYYHGENFTKTVDSTTKQFKISIDQPTDGSGTYSWDSTDAILSLNNNPSTPETPTGVTVTAKKSDGTDASSASEISYFLVEGVMPNSALYITLPLTKKYNMKLANIVVTDTIGSKTMLTEGAATTDVIGSITAVPSLNGTAGSDISTDGITYYTYDGNNDADTVTAYTSSTNNVQIRGGLNKIGTDVTAGSTVTYSFTFENGNDANYSFVGWYEGSLSGDVFTVDYSKKLSGKTSFTYTPKKDTVVIAVGTRDMYLGGNFTSDGAYTSTSANQTWSSGRILMNYDPTYVNPSNSSQKGRYYYTFDTVTANTEYQFRVYDTVSSTGDHPAVNNITVWNAHLDDISYVFNDDEDIADYRSKYSTDGVWTTHAGFMFTNTSGKSFSEIKNNGTAISSTAITENHATNGYGNPVTVYFYAYDSGVSVDATYQWSKAYVSAGVGIDVLSRVFTVSGTDTTYTNSQTVPDGATYKSTNYNTPSASVASTTVAGGTVDVSYQQTKYGAEKDKDNNTINKYEKIYECTVKEKDGQIQVTADPNDTNLCVQAFLIYNIDTKESEAIMVNSAEATGAITANITIPQNSKLYIVPIYKFTNSYIETAGLETHTVYVRAEDIDKDDWGGLVSMYSWGTDSGFDSGGWPGQLMIPSDDGNSFYAPLTFKPNGLAGVTFSNYTQVWGGKFVNFLGTYQANGVSDTVYSSYTNTSTHYINQAYDYREPISIIENINDGGIYDSEDMDLTFALKQGNKNGDNFGSGAYSASYDWEYLTDRSGKKRVDLNGNALSTSATATYYVVCSYTRDYVSGGSKSYDFKDGSRDGTSAHNCYSIEWTVYDQEHTKIGSEKLSAAYTDVYKSEMLTYVAKMLDSYGYPVSGKAVQIAYEDPGVALLNEDGNATEAKRFSGQWYADGVNSLIEGNVRVGIYSDGAWLPSDSNAPGYGTATVSVTSGAGFTIPNVTTGEAFETEDGCSGNSLVKVTKTHATNGGISFTVNTTDNFLGWYRDDGEGGFEPVGSNYKNQTITPSFNSDITYYAFYSASASYRVKYTGRDGSIKYFTAKGTDLTSAELADSNQYLNDSERASDISTKLAKSSDINVFNKSYSITFSSPTKTAYTLTYDAVQNDSTYTLTAYYYDTNGDLTQHGTVTGAYNTEVDLTDSEIGGAGTTLAVNHPSGKPYFVGWQRYDGTNFVGSEIISTHANFGYALSEDLTIAPVFSDTKPSTEGTWSAYVDKNVITQELTNATTGIIYNDNIVSFKYSADTATQVNRETNECGIVILAQTGSVTSAQSTSFTGLTDDKMETYLTTLKDKSKTSAKMSSSTYGEAYAFYIPAASLSRLNRIDIYQVLDYAKFNGGNYKVAAYYKNSDGTYTMSNVISDTYTPHSYSRATGTRTPAAD